MAFTRTILQLCMAAVAAAGLSGACGAGTISMQVTCSLTGTNLVVSVVNRGGEPAQNVKAEVAFLDRRHQSPARQQMQPDDSLTASFALRQLELTGTYPAVVTVYFEDLNAYPFSSVTVHPVAFGSAGMPRIFGTLEAAVLRRKATLKLRVRNHSADRISAQCGIVAARELLVESPPEPLDLSPNSVSTVRIRVENFSVLPGSSYPVYAILEYDEGGEHFCAIASSTLRVQRPLPFDSVGFWIILLIAACGVGWALLRSRGK